MTVQPLCENSTATFTRATTQEILRLVTTTSSKIIFSQLYQFHHGCIEWDVKLYAPTSLLTSYKTSQACMTLTIISHMLPLKSSIKFH